MQQQLTVLSPMVFFACEEDIATSRLRGEIKKKKRVFFKQGVGLQWKK